MIEENRAQISLEYLLIFTISLIIIIVFTLPLAQQSIEDTIDVYDVLCAKSELSKISQAIKTVYGQGQGSKQTIHLHISKPTQIRIDNDGIYSNMKLSDNSDKMIWEYVTSNIERTSISLDDGENIITVEWPSECESMQIYK